MSAHDSAPGWEGRRAGVVVEADDGNNLTEDQFLQSLEEVARRADIEVGLKSLISTSGVSTRFWSKGLFRVADAEQTSEAVGPYAFFQHFVAEGNEAVRNLLYVSRDEFGHTILHKAVDNKNPRLAKLVADGCVSFSETSQRFKKNGQDDPVARSNFVLDFIHSRTIRGSTALHFASLLCDTRTVDALISIYDKLDIPPKMVWNFLDKAWMTPLHYAVLQKNEPIVTRLLSSKVYVRHVNVGDWSLRTPLHIACSVAPEGPYTDALLVIEKLLKSPHVDVNALDCCRFTPLHWAVYVRSIEVVRTILAKAAERTIRSTEEDWDGRTVLQHALTKPHPHEAFSRDKYNSNDELQRRGKDVGRLLMENPGVKVEVETLYRDRQVYVDAANAMLVGAALIASVTFGGWLQAPLGDHALRYSRRIVRVFWVFNSLSFFFAIASVMAAAGAVLPMANVYIGDGVARLRNWLAMTALLLLISVTCVLVSFATAGFAAGTEVPDVDLQMKVTTVVGSVVCGLLGVFFLRGLYHTRPGWGQLLMSQLIRAKNHHKFRSCLTCFKGILGLECRGMRASQSRSRTSMRHQYQLQWEEAIDRAFSLLSQNDSKYSRDEKKKRLVVEALGQACVNMVKQGKHQDKPLQMLQFVNDMCPDGLRKTKHRKSSESSGQYKKDPEEEELDELVAEMVTKWSGRGLLHMLVDLPTTSCRDICLRNNLLDFIRILRDRDNCDHERSCVYTVPVSTPGRPFVHCKSCPLIP